jgi:ribosome-associated translation inhibitor RaiA/cold shock CspA family protein
MDIHIEGHHTQVGPEVREWITQRLEALDTPYQDILHARVTLLKHERHHKGSEEVRIFVTLPGKTLPATGTGETLDDALYEAMEIITQDLRTFRTRRQYAVKTPGPRPRGRIVRLFPESGYGFIETESHREVYFHAHALHGIAFATLTVGMPVELEIEEGHAGLQASRVIPSTP